MGAPGRTEQVIGTLPMAFSFPAQEYPVMLDACMAYASFGVLKEKMDKNEPVPPYWGFDAEGKPTTDPHEMAKGTRLPIGGHKGFALAILGEVLTALLSQGCIVDEEDAINGQSAPTSHTAIAIKADALMPLDEFRGRTCELVERMEARAPGLHVPGERSFQVQQSMEQAGIVSLKDSLLDELDMLSDQLHMAEVLKREPQNT